MQIEVNKDNIRIDQYLVTELDISRSKIQKLIKQEKILVNDKSVSSSYIVRNGDRILIDDNLDFSINVEAVNWFLANPNTFITPNTTIILTTSTTLEKKYNIFLLRRIKYERRIY